MNAEAQIDTNESIELMAAETMGVDLMALIIQEFKALPDVWQKLPEYAQNEVIERVHDTVDRAITKAVMLIASAGQTRIAGELDKVTLSDKRQAVINVMATNPIEAMHDLYESVRQPVLIVVASSQQFKGGMDDVRGDADQKDLPGIGGDE